MNGFDFHVNYFAGRLMWLGLDPYQTGQFLYPYPVAYFWMLMSVFGDAAEPPMFIAWGLVNFALLVWAWGRDFWKWLLYFPVVHEFSSGQVELLLWTLERHIRPGWRGAILAAIITLKPQTALIVLPHHLIGWLRTDRPTLAKWVLCTALIWLTPLLWRPDWIAAWLGNRVGTSNWVLSATSANGLWTLLRLTGEPLVTPPTPGMVAPLIIVGLIAVIVYLVGQFQPNRPIAKACAMLGSPLGLIYTQMHLMGTAPWWLLVPVSWIAFGLTLVTGTLIPAMLTPLAVIAWQVWAARQAQRASGTAAT